MHRFAWLARLGVALASAALAGSCALLRDCSTYERLLAHEREFAEVEIVRYDLRVDLRPAEGVAHVAARVTLRNMRARALEHVRLLVAPEAHLGTTRSGGVELVQRARLERLGELAAQSVELRGFPPIERGEEGELDLDYVLRPSAVTLGLRLEAEHGYMLLEALWAPMLRTPLSSSGMDRAPLALEVTLPAPLEPVGLVEFELVAEDEGTRTYRGTSDFPFAPFLAYGAFTRNESSDGRERVYSLAPPTPLRAATFVLETLAELRRHFEAAFGAVSLSCAKLAVVRRFGASWGAPCCILLDEGSWPREAWQEPGIYQLLAHELAHTWWGSGVAMHGRGGYLHEGLANWCAADALGARYGAEAAERAFEAWLMRYARGERPLGRRLRDVSILDWPSYERGAYLVGAHFYRALGERLGRERFVALLRRFHGEFASRSADLGDLWELARRECGGELDDLFERWVDSREGGDELHARGRERLEARTSYWRSREPAPRVELCARVEAVLAQVLERAAGSDLATLPPGERSARAAELFGSCSALPELQVTVIDANGELVFHAEGLGGSVLGHRDVRGGSVYGAILDDARTGGTLANFDYLSEDLRAARENAIAWHRLGTLVVLVEGHAWRALE